MAIFILVGALVLGMVASRKNPDIRCWATGINPLVRQLRNVSSHNDPIITRLAAYGDDAIPCLLGAFTKEKARRPATWVFSEMGSEAAIVPLTRLYETRPTSAAVGAVFATLDARPDLCRPTPESGRDPDREHLSQELLSRAVQKEGLEGSGQDWIFPDRSLFKGSGLPDEVVVARSGLTTNQVFALPGWKVDILDEAALEEWAEVYDDFLYFRFHDACLYEIQNPAPGSSIDAYAALSLTTGWKKSRRSDVIYLSGGGVRTWWLRREGKWTFIGIPAFWGS